MSKENPPFEYYQNFVQDAISSGAHFREKMSPKAQRVWDETVDTVVISAFSDIYVSDLRSEHGVGRADVALRRRRGVEKLYEAAPEKLQEKYNPQLLRQSYAKRPYTSTMSQHRSRRRRGKAAATIDYLREHPELTAEQAIAELGYKGEVRSAVVKRLKKWGRSDVAEHAVLHTDAMLEEIAKAKTYTERQRAIEKVTKSFMEKNIRGDNSILIPLIAEIRKMGFRVHYRYGGSEVYISALKDGEVAVGTLALNVTCPDQKYTFAFREDLRKIEEVLIQNPITGALQI